MRGLRFLVSEGSGPSLGNLPVRSTGLPLRTLSAPGTGKVVSAVLPATADGSATVATNGYARAGFRLYSRGTWEVRVVRLATTGHTTGYSSTRRLTAG